MMKEAVDCPVKAKRVSFVECFTCSNFNQRIKGKVGCAGLRVVGPREEEEGNAATKENFSCPSRLVRFSSSDN